MNTLVNICGEKRIEDMIYEIRGKMVMLDSDLAKLYGCKNGTKSINLAASRNKERFPKDFYFQLSREEYDSLKFHNETSSNNNYGGIRKIPYVFTEEGVAMLASVLHTEIAHKISVDIMRAFVAMRHYIGQNLLEQKYINSIALEDHEKLLLLEESFNKLEEKKEK